MRYRLRFEVFLAALLMVAVGAAVGQAQTRETPMPEDHQVTGWLTDHGDAAKADVTFCAACHAREYCSRCHVNAERVPEIQALRSDPKVGEYVAGRRWPAPANHTPFFLEDHRAPAAAATSSCTTCHVVQQECQTCHTGSETVERRVAGGDGREANLYHPADFLARHSAAAFNREAECATCHNPQIFCQSCHASLGRGSADGRTDTGFHNESSAFQLGHGQAARQGLESCASCHRQEDCLACHSAKSGRNVNPHGPSFEADRLRSKNRGFCLLCHFSGQIEP
jgi:hypothetical protein